jgi:hypothetical protein
MISGMSTLMKLMPVEPLRTSEMTGDRMSRVQMGAV